MPEITGKVFAVSLLIGLAMWAVLALFLNSIL